MTNNNTNITVSLDSVAAVNYLTSLGYPDEFKDEETITKAFLQSANDFLAQKIDTLLFCSICNKLYYLDILKNQIKIQDSSLDSLLNDLSELQYYDLIHDVEKTNKCLKYLDEFLATKNRES